MIENDFKQIMSNNKKDLQMILTVKDSDGKTFESLESLNFEFKVIPHEPTTFGFDA